MFRDTFTADQIKYAIEAGIDDDRMLSDILRRELSSGDSGHLRNVVRSLVMSHLAANERIRELEQNIAAISRKSPVSRS